MGIRVGSAVLNVSDIERGIAFWTKALDYVLRDPSAGHEDFVVLCHRDRNRSNISLQRSDEPKVGVNRVHLDLYADDQAPEVARLEGIGATRVEPWPYEENADHVVMADPDGNEFCVVQIV
ncbi:MAG: VOC family protein [Actinomycetota bacterium]